MDSFIKSLPAGFDEPVLNPAEVARIFRVDPKTVSRWAQQGKIICFRTPGGHRRFPEAEVRKYLDELRAARAAS